MAGALRGVKTRYEVKEVIARGGMGIVYKAYDKVMKRPVALKTLLDLTDNKAVQLFQKECEDLASLIHPNIIEIFDVGQLEEDGGLRPYLVMPLLPGITLEKLIKTSSSRLSVERCVDIFCQTCRGLQAAHERGLIHRDLKPSNIFVMEDDSVKIIDFGVAHRVAANQSVGRKGTLIYMSPEQISMLPLTPASDIFSLGVVCYEALTRRRPFERRDEPEIADAILHYIPPPAHQVNGSVSPVLSQAIHKAMAKNAIHRYRTAKEFADTLQRALRNEQIEGFNRSRIQARLERARSAYEKADYEFAAEIIAELESEGHVDSSLTELKSEMVRARTQRRVNQLIETARTRVDEQEYQIALQKISEALELDPNNTDALALQAKVDSRRTNEDIEGWFELARTHLANGAFAPAREALKRILQLRPREPKATQLLSEVERGEQTYLRLREEKEALYRAAMDADRNGDISSAITKLERVLELDKRAPEPSRTGVYQRLYDKVRTDHDALKNARAEAKRFLDDKKFPQALAICTEYLAKYPADTLFQALKYDVEEKQRKAMSARIAETDRSVEAEPDLDRRVSILEGAVQENRGVPHFEHALRNARDKRDMVNSIVARARACEERNQLNEALAQWEILKTVYSRYPGLNIEIERVNKRREHARRQDTKARWVEQIDQHLESGDFQRARELVRMAEEELPNDPELAELARLAEEGEQRDDQARNLLGEGQAACDAGNFEQGIEALRRSYELDGSNSKTRTMLVETLVEQGRRILDVDPTRARMLFGQALEIEPNHRLAKGLLTLIADRQKSEVVDSMLARVRRLQAERDFRAADRLIREGLEQYPGEQRLFHAQSSVRKSLQDIRRRDLEQAKRIALELDSAAVIDEDKRAKYVDNLAKYLTEYPGDEEFRTVADPARKRLQTIREPIQAPFRDDSHPGAEVEQNRCPPSPDPFPEIGRESAEHAGLPQISNVRTRWIPPLSRNTILVGGGLLAALAALIVALFISPHKRHTAPAFPLMGSVEVAVLPADSVIFVDGNEIGTANEHKSIQKRTGNHDLEVRRPGYVTQHRNITFQPGQTARVSFKLVPENPTLRIAGTGQVTIDSDPPADIADGQFSHVLTSGDHTISISMNHVASTSFKVHVGADGLAAISDVTAKEVNPLIVSNFGSSAQIFSGSNSAVPVYLEGKPIGTVSQQGLTLPSLAPNVYALVFGDGKDAKTRQIEIGPSRTVSALLEADPNVGTLLVRANEDDATVIVVSKDIPIAQKQTKNGQVRFANLRAHSYVIQISKSGYDAAPSQQVAEIKKGEEADLAFELRKRLTSASVRIVSVPDAEILIDGSPAATASAEGIATVPNVAFGTHRVESRRKGYQPRSTELTVAEGQDNSVELRLSRSLGRVTILKNVPGAVVSYTKAGENTNSQVNANSLDLPEGNYVFTATAPRYLDAEAQVAVSAGEQSSVDLKLAPVPVIEIHGIEAAWGKKFVQPAPGDWYIHKGDGFVGLSRSTPGMIEFTAPLIKSGTFGHEKLIWATNFRDTNNYVRYELDHKELKITKVSGIERTSIATLSVAHAAIYTVKLDCLPDTITISVNGAGAKRLPLDGSSDVRDIFGFLGNREVRLFDFKYREVQ